MGLLTCLFSHILNSCLLLDTQALIVTNWTLLLLQEACLVLPIQTAFLLSVTTATACCLHLLSPLSIAYASPVLCAHPMSIISLLGQELSLQISHSVLSQVPCRHSWAPTTTPVFPTFQSPKIPFVIKELYNLYLKFAVILIFV